MNETDIKEEQELVLRRLSDAFPFASPEASVYCWWILVIGVLLLGAAFAIWKYRRDARTCGGRMASLLAGLRIAVYALLAFAFMLPARQKWETSEKHSNVVILIDVSASVGERGDDAASGNDKPITRLDRILDCLSDDKIAFLKKLLARNPVYVYRFGAKLDEEPQIFKGETGWTNADWQAWARYDFKPWIFRNLSEKDRAAVTAKPAWGGKDTGNANWAINWLRLPMEEVAPVTTETKDGKEVAVFALENAAAFNEARGKLESRVDTSRSIVQGTNLPDTMLGALKRESANMVQALIVFSDGRSNPGIDTTFARLRERAGEKVPVFTIAVGEARENLSIVITEMQAPDRATPDEEFKVFVEADGLGLEGKQVPVKLDLYLPKKDPLKDAADHTLDATMTFEANDPPHGRVEIRIDPEKMPDKLKEEVVKNNVKKKVLKQGAWNVVARIPRVEGESYPNAFHTSPARVVNVIDSPLRILLWASGPTREYQTLRTLLMREVESQRAEVSICLQTEGGTRGEIAQDVDKRRMLQSFPSRNVVKGPSTPEDKYYNMDEYDLIIAFDPDWSELSKDQVDMVANWVTVGGGGFIYVAGAINTHQLARTYDAGRMKAVLEMMPVVPADRFLVAARAIPRTPRRLVFSPNPLIDVLKLDDTVADDPTAGWERYFTNRARYEPDADPAKNLNPARGFFSYYPVTLVKDDNPTLIEFLDVNERGEAEPRPYLVVSSPQRQGRVAFFAGGEMYRIRYPEVAYYDRFWIRMARAMSVDRRNKQSFRGQVMVNKEYSANAMIRVSARLLDPKSKPYPSNGIFPKFRVEQYEGLSKTKEFGPFPLEEKKTGGAFDGYYQAQVLADAKQFPSGEFRYKVVVDIPESSGDSVSGEFKIRKANPELDNIRPDFAAMITAASTLDEAKAGIRKPEVLARLRGSASSDDQVKLAFNLNESEKIGMIPECIDSKQLTTRNRGAVKDLWDAGFTFGNLGGDHNKPILLSFILFATVGLLGTEWMLRKIARLA